MLESKHSAHPGKPGEHIRFEILTPPDIEHFLAEHEVADIDPRFTDDRLFDEFGYASRLLKSNGSILRTQRRCGECGETACVLMEIEQPVQVDVAQTVTVCGEETL